MTKKSTPPADEPTPNAPDGEANAAASQATGETPAAEPDHSMPSEGGSYFRQADGSLVRQDAPEKKDD